jgi:L-ribulose-5-phosphate 4-epimerase
MDQGIAKKLVAEAGKKLLHEQLTARTWGNVSCKVNEDTMVITPSGLGYDGMTPDDIVTMNLSSGEWEGHLKPSSEKGVHIATYQQFPEVGFVIHTHQIYASAICVGGFDQLEITSEEQQRLEGIALAKYALPSTKKLKQNVTDTLKSGDHVILMENHGTIVAGKDAEDAFAKVTLLEEICKRSCKGQPSEVIGFDDLKAKQLLEAVKKVFGSASFSATPAIIKCASQREPVVAQLDDMAQMIGRKLMIVEPNQEAVLKALAKTDVILVPTVGAICRASSEGDLTALSMLAEKSCVGWLHTQALGVNARLSILDTFLMRTVYLKKYSKKIGG